MDKNDFRYMRRGKQLADLKEKEFTLIQPVNQYGAGSERALLLLHGFSSSPAAFRYLIPQLKNYDAIICPALPGHGSSIAEFSRVKASAWLDYTTELCTELFKKYQKIDLVGLSLGGLISCKLSERFSFNHIFLLAPALKLNMNIKNRLHLANLLHRLGFAEIRGAAGNLVSDEHAEISYRKLPITAVIELFNFVLQHQWVAPGVPLDLFLGTQDTVVASLEIEELFHNLPNATVHWLNNSAHVLSLDNDLEQIVECINHSSR